MIYSQKCGSVYISLRVRFALIRRESGFISGLVAVLHDTTEQEKRTWKATSFQTSVMNCELLWPVSESYLEALDEGHFQNQLHQTFIRFRSIETNRMIRMVTDLLHLSRIDNATSHLDVELINFTALLLLSWIVLIKIRSQDEEKKYEIVRDYPITSVWIEIDTDKMTPGYW